MSRSQSYFRFQPFPNMKFSGFQSQEVQDFLAKWSMKDGINIQGFSFSPQYKEYLQAEFVLDFFSDESVLRSLNVKSNNTQNWSALGFKANCVRQRIVPCTQTTTNLFEKLENEERVVRRGGSIVRCLPEFFRPPTTNTNTNSLQGSGDSGQEPEMEIGNLLQKFVLQKMCLQAGKELQSEELRIVSEEEGEIFEGLLKEEESGEFLFQILSHLVVGGTLCQYEDSVVPYIQVATKIYKDLISVAVDKEEEEVRVKSHVIKVHSVSQHDGDPQIEEEMPSLIFCRSRLNNFMYIVIDPVKSLVFTFYHQVI